jgi:hypothetical protein
MENLTYDEFIQNILNTRGRFACGDEYHERHHITPKCLGGSNEEENLVDLYAKEHFVAHKLLAKENPDNDSLTHAWWCMASAKRDDQERYELTPQEYEDARVAYVDMLKDKMIGDGNPMYGRKHTEESRQRMRENAHVMFGEDNPRYGQRLTEEIVEKISQSQCKRFENPEARKRISECAKLRVRGLNPKARKVIRLCDFRIYDCLLNAVDDNEISKSTMIKRCKEKRDFMYYDEWIIQQNNKEVADAL